MAQDRVNCGNVLQYWVPSPSPPDAIGTKLGFASQLARQVPSTRVGREGGERRTAAAPVYCRGWVAICGARKVGERRVGFDLGGEECGDALTLQYGRMDESGQHERKGRGLQKNHDRREENDERRCSVDAERACKYHGLYRLYDRIWAIAVYYSHRLLEKKKSHGAATVRVPRPRGRAE